MYIYLHIYTYIYWMCAEVSADDEDVVTLCNEFNFALKWFSKADIKEAVLRKFTDNMGW